MVLRIMRWVGYILASILILSVIVGGGLFIAASILLVGLAICLITAVVFVAFAVKEYFESKTPHGGP